MTGDVVHAVQRGGRWQPTAVDPGPGRTGIAFTTDATGGHLRVTPSDALPLLEAGRLDPRLFDVTTLLGFGYDDRRGDLPLIATGGTTRARTRAAKVPGTAGVRSLRGAAAFRTSRRSATPAWRALSGELRGNGLTKLWLDGLRRPALHESVPQIGAPAAWAAGFTGRGVTVGVVDSGIDADHPDLAGQVVAAQNFVPDGDPRDLTGHGTHVASTIAGTGAAEGNYRGVAPGAKLISARVCRPGGCPDSSVLAGMQWAADSGAKIINMSLGGEDSPGQDLVEQTVDRISRDSGVLFVIAAGNDGEWGDSTLGSPGTADSALTVGAVDKADELADFSSRGPRLGDGAIKPDVTAPGVDITAARSGALGGTDLHATASGTSMATPHVAGSAALLAQQHPDWTWRQLKSALMGSARANPGLRTVDQGAGRVDLARAVTQTVLADPPSLSLQDTWPLEAAPIVRPITYANTGSAPVTLDLRLDTAAPAGEFTLAASSVTVPAGGTATVDLAVDTRVAGVGPREEGYLVATGDGQQVTTPFAAAVETEESYGLETTAIGADGGAPGDFVTAIVNPQRDTAIEVKSASSTVRLPKGTYVLMTLFRPADSSQPVRILVDPAVVLDRDRSVVTDARNAKPVQLTAPQPGAGELLTSAYTVALDPAGFILYTIAFNGTTGGVRLGTDQPGVTAPAAQALVASLFTPGGAPAEDSPWLAHLTYRSDGKLFDGLRRSPRAGAFAVTRAEYARAASDTGTLTIGSVALDPVGRDPLVAMSVTTPLRRPSTRLEYVNTDTDLQRQYVVRETSGLATLTSQTSPLVGSRPGWSGWQRRGAAVFGPGFPVVPAAPAPGLRRDGDTLQVAPALLDDAQDWWGRPTATEQVPTLTVLRDGVQVAQKKATALSVPVPAGPAAYRVTADLTRSGVTLSTGVHTEWTFRSDSTAAATALPVSAIRFTPRLDLTGTAPAGRWFELPIEVQRQPGSAAGPVRSLGLEVSYDDGVTWTAVPVVRRGPTAVAGLRHPAAGFVSLRANAVDRSGSAVTETLIRAYRLG